MKPISWVFQLLYVFQIICVLPLQSMAIILFIFIFDNYCMGPSVRQLIVMMVPSVYELISIYILYHVLSICIQCI